MNRFKPSLLLFPSLGALMLIAAYLLNSNAIKLVLTGDREPGRIAAMLKLRSEDADLITRLATQVIFTREDGTVLDVKLTDYVPVSGRLGEQTEPLAALAKTNPAAFPDLSADEASIVDTVARGDAAAIRRVLKREARNESPGRIVRIEKIELASGWLGLPVGTKQFEVAADGHIRPATIDTAPPHLVRTRAVFVAPSATSPSAGKDVMTEYEQTRDNEPSTPAKNDFILFCEPYTTVARPVYSFISAAGPKAVLSDLGRRGAPSLAFPLFAPCNVAFDPSRPERAVLLADVGQPDSRIGYLNWFSKAGEGIFTRWASLVILVAGGLGLLAVGIILITLSLDNRTEMGAGQPGHTKL